MAWNWKQWGGAALAGLGVAAGGVLIATGLGAPLGLAVAGAGLKIGGDIISGETNALNTEEQARNETSLATAERTSALTHLTNSYAIDASDQVTSIAEQRLAELERSLGVQRELGVQQLDAQVAQAEYSLGVGVGNAQAAEGQVLARAARSGVRGGSIGSSVNQAIKAIGDQMAAGEREVADNTALAAAQLDEQAASAGADINLFKQETSENLRYGTEQVEEAFSRSTVLTSQLKTQAQSYRVNSYLAAAGDLFDLGTSLGQMGLLDQIPDLMKYRNKGQFGSSDNFPGFGNKGRSGYQNQYSATYRSH